jgi:hypothetical protein
MTRRLADGQSGSWPNRRTPYIETFDAGNGGWFAWQPAAEMPSPSDESTIQPLIRNGAYVTQSPWWVDSNHAPPGAGYLHLLAFLPTSPVHAHTSGSPNAFIDQGYSTDLRNARMTLRLRGEVDLRGAELVVLAQATVPDGTANLVLTGQPFPVTSDWSEQSVTLTTDSRQWTCLGARHDLLGYYCCGEPADVLRDVDVDLILVLFPLHIVATEPVADIHLGRPHHRVTQPALRSGNRSPDPGYEVDWNYLPEGQIEFDTIRIDYPDGRP